MGRKDPRVDAYIANAAPFARPILVHLRKLVHTTVPGIEEDMKWSAPAFMHEGILCIFAAFKNYCALNVWKSSLVFEGPAGKTDMERLGRIASIEDLPSDRTLIAYLQKAARLNEEGVKLPKQPAQPRQPLAVPGYLTAALRKNKEAREAFERFSYSHRKEYVEWLADAKTEATRLRRLDTALGWMAEGKSRNWKYASR